MRHTSWVHSPPAPLAEQYLVTGEAPLDPVADRADVTRLLRLLAARETPTRVIRVYRPSPVAAFSGSDSNRPGFPDAEATARERGFPPVVRPAGGKAVVYDPSCLIAEVFRSPRQPDPRLDFEEVADRLHELLRGLGLDARIGELAGEFCPGRHSINVAGRRKVVGIAQRIYRTASLTSSVVMVRHAPHLRDVTAALYAQLGYPWEESTFGSLEDELPGHLLADLPDLLIAALTDGPATPCSLDDLEALLGQPEA